MEPTVDQAAEQPAEAGADTTADAAPPATDATPTVPAPDAATDATATVAIDPTGGMEGTQQIVDLLHSVEFLPLLAVFVLAIFVGYYVVWNVTPALHSPLMAVTNAISSVIIVGALIAAGTAIDSVSTVFGFLAVILASVNIFGGFLVTRRMLAMYRKRVR